MQIVFPQPELVFSSLLRRWNTFSELKIPEELGVDAIINVRFVTTSVVASVAELLVYGTAVKLK